MRTRDKSPTTVFSTADLRKNLGEVIARAHYQGQVVDISHHGQLCAAIVSQEDAEFIKMKKDGAALVSQNDAEFLERVRAVGGSSLKEFKRTVERAIDDGKSIRELVEDLENALSTTVQKKPSKTDVRKPVLSDA